MRARRPNRGMWIGKRIREWQKQHRTKDYPPKDVVQRLEAEWEEYREDWYQEHQEWKKPK